MGVVTLGAISIPVYGTGADRDAYFSTRFGAEPWIASADQDLKDRSHVSASERIALALKARGAWFDPSTADEHPEMLRKACYEQVLGLFSGTAQMDASNAASRLRSVYAGSVRVDLAPARQGVRVRTAPGLTQLAAEFLGAYVQSVAGASASGTRALAFGVDGESAFFDPNDIIDGGL